MKAKTRFVTFALVFLLLMISSTALVLAQGEEPPGPTDMTLTAILVWVVAGPGAAWLVGMLQTQVLENISGWHELPPQVKFLITMGLAALFPVLAQLLLAWPALPQIEPWANTIIMAIVVWLSSQKQYRTLKVEGSNYGIRKPTIHSVG